MKISTAGDVRIETDWPCAIDIEQNEQDLMAFIHLATNTPQHDWEGQVVRVLLRDDVLGIFVSQYPDAEPPDWWKYAKEIFVYRQREGSD